nr:uncharacterized protein LOC128686754 [Cherax quadricarinatus]
MSSTTWLPHTIYEVILTYHSAIVSAVNVKTLMTLLSQTLSNIISFCSFSSEPPSCILSSTNSDCDRIICWKCETTPPAPPPPTRLITFGSLLEDLKLFQDDSVPIVIFNYLLIQRYFLYGHRKLDTGVTRKVETQSDFLKPSFG